MDADATGSIFGGPVDLIDLIDDRLNGLATELVTEDIQADLFIRCIKCPDRRFDALHRTAVAKRALGAQIGDNCPAACRGVGYPLAPILGEHVVAHVVHNLDTLYFRVNL